MGNTSSQHIAPSWKGPLFVTNARKIADKDKRMKRELELRQEFGKRLKVLRANAKFNQQTVADRAGLDRSYVSDLERGVKEPGLAVIFWLAKAYETTVSKILFDI